MLQFGIPSLDRLLDLSGARGVDDGTVDSCAIVGPDGTGKSVLSLHLASQYHAAYRRRKKADPTIDPSSSPRIIYVSSDLKIQSAKKVWSAFKLCVPTRRHIPFERNRDWLERQQGGPYCLALAEIWPTVEPGRAPRGVFSMSQFLFDGKGEKSVGFLDLASHTSGDDWMYVNTLLGQLESIKTHKINGKDLPHLMIIDSVLGFETFVGRLDAYGVEQTRRARIAQCMRNAGSHCHLVFVVEEPNENEHLPEEYVTNSVIRLRQRPHGGAVTRTLAIEKARARDHALGEHPFEVRGAEGSFTGYWENADTPVATNHYVQVFPSLGHISMRVAADRTAVEQSKNSVAGFGLDYLDELLNGQANAKEEQESSTEKTRRGLPVGTCTAVLGDASTGKSALAEKFLAEGFKDIIIDFIRICARVSPKGHDSLIQEAWQRVLGELSSSVLSGAGPGSTNAGGITDVATALKAGGDASTKNLLEDYAGDPLLLKWDESARRELRSQVEKVAPGMRTRPGLVFASGCADFTPEKPSFSSVLELFNHPNLRRPVVLLTTSDRRAEDVAKACLTHLTESLDREVRSWWPETFATVWEDRKVDGVEEKGLRSTLVEFLERQLIVSRFDIADRPSPILYHVIWRNILEAKKLLFGTFFPPRSKVHTEKTWRIRAVIDDLRLLCTVSPQIAADGAFLPFLKLMLERSGITSLIVYTDAVRPDTRPEDSTSRTLLSLIKRCILVWTVPFEGRSRFAIAVVPPTRHEYNGIVRELSLDLPRSEFMWAKSVVDPIPTPLVTPEFELYSGIEEGKPKSVPLAVYLYAETKQFANYIDEEDTLFRELFHPVEQGSPVRPERVIFPVDRQRYLAMRDYTHLSSDAVDGHTMVFQVDGSWDISGAGSLSSQKEYLNERLDGSPRIREYQDPFGVFRPRTGVACRREYFANSHYSMPMTSADRVPFTWDFGLLLLRTAPWKMFEKRTLTPAKPQSSDGDQWFKDHQAQICKIVPLEGVPETVGDVYRQLSMPGTEPEGNCRSWRKFFGACRMVADMHKEQTGAPALAFDLSASSSESINTMMLEVWFSEIVAEAKLRGPNVDNLPLFPCPGPQGAKPHTAPLQEILRQGLAEGRTVKEAFQKFRKDWREECSPGNSSPDLIELKLAERRFAERQPGRPDDPTLSGLFNELPLGAICLYKTWLLLVEVLDFEDFLSGDQPFEFKKGRRASLQAVASRHWYKTACSFAHEMHEAEGIHDCATALRLPGNFSSRGDWFLASPRRSRSRLVAQQAFDLLCSRRSNMSRMQNGLGLPVRDLLWNSKNAKADGELGTALRCWLPREESEPTDGDHVSRQMKYRELAALGQGEGVTPGDPEAFQWIWRSAIPNYDRQSRVFQKWTARLFRWTVELRNHLNRDWRSGFQGYDDLTCRRFSSVYTFPSFEQFAAHCDLLIAELGAAAPGNSGDGANG